MVFQIEIYPDILSIPYGDRKRILDASQGEKDLVNLASDNPDMPMPSFITERLRASLGSGYAGYTNYYGLPELRQRLSQYLKRECQISADPEKEILVTHGVQEGLYIVVMKSILHPGDEVLIVFTVRPTSAGTARIAFLGERYPFEPVGFWVDIQWATIAQDLKRRLDYSKLEVLFSDNGPDIQGTLVEEAMAHQRCIWHGKRDFPDVLYADGSKKFQQQSFKKKLDAIPAMGLDKAQLEQLKPEDVPEVKELADNTRQAFRELIQMLDPSRYPKARAYIENLSDHLCTFFDWWIEHKQWIFITTDAVETAFSQVKNRIKRIGRRWTEKGLINWLRVTVKEICFLHL